MPSSDLVLNVRQVAGYPLGPVDGITVLLGQRGLGGPYVSMCPSDIVSTALAQGGDMVIGGQLMAQSVQAGSGQFSNLATGLFSADNAAFNQFDAAFGTIAGEPIAVTSYVDGAVAAVANVAQSLYENATVWSFNQRTGQVILRLEDVMGAGGAPIWSPVFQGCPSAPTPAPLSRNTRLATTEWVWANIEWSQRNLLATQPFVFSFNGRSGAVMLTPEDLASVHGAPLNDANLTGTPTAPTANAGTSTTQIATTAFVNAAIQSALADELTLYAPLLSPAFTGQPTAPTAPPGSSTGQLATTSFVMNAVTASTTGVASVNTRTGAVVLQSADITDAGGALLASPIFTGTPQAPTANAGDNSNRIATTAWVLSEIGGANVGVMSFNGRGGAVTLTAADITGASGAVLASPAFSGVPTAPTATAGTSTGQLATTAFVMSELGSFNAVVTFNGRGGAVTLTAADISAAGGAALTSPAFTGSPTAPTQNPGTNNTTLATTAYVAAAIAAAGGVTSFNGRGGAVTLTAADISAAGGATGGPYLALIGGTLSGALTVNAATTLGPTAHQSIFDANGQLRLTGAPALGANAQFGHVFLSGSGVVAAPVTTGLSLASNAYGDGTNWRFIASGTAAALQIGGLGCVLNLWGSAGTAGALTGAGTGSFQFQPNGNMVITGTLSQASDARGKRDIAPMSEGIDEIRRLAPCRYLRLGSTGDELGFIAQDVQAALPVAVNEDDKGMLSIALSPLIAVLVNAVKQLDARLAALEVGT